MVQNSKDSRMERAKTVQKGHYFNANYLRHGLKMHFVNFESINERILSTSLNLFDQNFTANDVNIKSVPCQHDGPI